jgi:hypothetical protein
LTKRHQRRQRVDDALATLAEIIKGDYSPGYYNRKEVIAAERAGLSVCDAVLGHVLRAAQSTDVEARASELLRRICARLTQDEAENQCHNIHATIVMYLDLIGCPAIVAWGTLAASATGSSGFILTSAMNPQFEGHRPGHTWVVTPFASVADLALAYQHAAGDDYDMLKCKIPKLIVTRERTFKEPEASWFRLHGASKKVPAAVFDDQTSITMFWVGPR